MGSPDFPPICCEFQDLSTSRKSGLKSCERGISSTCYRQQSLSESPVMVTTSLSHFNSTQVSSLFLSSQFRIFLFLYQKAIIHSGPSPVFLTQSTRCPSCFLLLPQQSAELSYNYLSYIQPNSFVQSWMLDCRIHVNVSMPVCELCELTWSFPAVPVFWEQIMSSVVFQSGLSFLQDTTQTQTKLMWC